MGPLQFVPGPPRFLPVFTFRQLVGGGNHWLCACSVKLAGRICICKLGQCITLSTVVVYHLREMAEDGTEQVADMVQGWGCLGH